MVLVLLNGYSKINDGVSTIGCIPVEPANEHLAIDSNSSLARVYG